MSNISEKTDEEITLLVQAGNIKFFGLLVDRYEEKLLRYAKRFLMSNDDAKDIVQEVFIKAYSSIQSFDASRRFSPWIYRIAHNEFVNAIKKKASKETVSTFDFDTFFPHIAAKDDFEDEINIQELRKILDQSLDKLNPKYREPLVLYYFEEMDYKEIADVLKIPISTVGVRLRRAKEILKKTAGPLG